ncbi:MAG TPA: hypothetical protein P5081_16485 [Phycisphaerae bacterium]|nr:hypothetical protein [Phycisphaerae bacterium]HRW54469.1 hypothetical protein [Phycisphaerae bacterium]
MILEHDFITTLDQQDAEALIQRQLMEMGFKVKRNSDGRDFVRGLRQASHARRPSDLPQTVRVEFDRGRVSIGVILETYGKAKPVHQDMLHLLAEVLENVVGRGVPAEIARQPWDRFEALNPKRRGCLETGLLIILILLLVVVFIIVIVASVSD